MQRNLVVCCDGTGNLWRAGHEATNVVKLVDALPADPDQPYFYDPGVGTADGLADQGEGFMAGFARIAGLAWGQGVWQNVADAYLFLMRHYRPGDRIFVFGFSRGAFTARAVAGLVNLCGVFRPEHENLVTTAIGVYRRSARHETGRSRRAEAAHDLREQFAVEPGGTAVHFVGVWDTVESVGLNALVFGTRITSPPTVKPGFLNVRHAVAIDEFRWPYAARLYAADDPRAPLPPNCRQVWFAGAHSDVGGSYTESGLANAALHWMVREANALGLRVDFAALDRHPVDCRGTLHDESMDRPAWSLTGVFRRDLPAGLEIHESVRARMDDPALRYRPPLPGGVTVVCTRDEVLEAGTPVPRPVPMVDASAPAASRPGWMRLMVNFALWCVLAAGCWWIIGHLTDGADRRLAWLQLTAGWVGRLGDVLAVPLAADESVTPARLLGMDLVLIALYWGVIIFAVRLALRFEDRDGYPTRLMGLWLCYAGGWIPVFDLLENLFTWLALPAGDVLAWHDRLMSVLTSVASFAKFACIVMFVAGLLACLARGLASRLRTARR